TQNAQFILEIIKLVCINMKYAQKQMKYVNILCLNASIAKKNMHLTQRNMYLLQELRRTEEKIKLK
ncbi:hypothetical protein BDBG_16602, partial [Blastomyces gilchristii SLH14081]